MERCFFEGTSGLADASYFYQFTCSPEETGRLIREMGLKRSRSPAGSTSAKGWKVEEKWTGGEPANEGADFIELETDASRRRVLVIAGWI